MNTVANRYTDLVVDWLFTASWQLALFIASVALAAWLLRKASPRLRYGLWVLVLVKALLPTTLGGAWSVGSWGVTPVRQSVPAADRIITATETIAAQPSARPPAQEAVIDTPNRASEAGDAPPLAAGRLLIAAVWLIGVAAVTGAVAVSYRRLKHAAAALPSADEGPLRVALEEAALAVGFGDAERVDLRVADRPTGPFLFGVRRPTIVLPAELAEQLEPAELRGVLAHELMHWRRRDTWVGWLQALVQTLFWFHPLAWWAAARLRDEREKSCDDAVLRRTRGDASSYGEAIVRSLTIGRGRPIGLTSSPPLAAAGLVGVFERGALLQQRLEDVMNFDPKRGRFGWRSAAVLALFAAVFLPMASRGAANAASQEVELAAIGLDEAADLAARIETDTQVKREGAGSIRITTEWPTTVCLAEVEAPDIENARLIYSAQVKSDLEGTASLEMWAHLDGGQFFSRNPNVAAFGKSDWKTLEIPFFFKEGQRPDKVTLNLIVNGKGTVWVDDLRLLKRPMSDSLQGGTAARPRGRREAAKNVVADRPSADTANTPYPVLVSTTPEIGATDVDPGLKEIRVTFDRDMDQSGYSWTQLGGGDESFPPTDPRRKTKWVDSRTCTLPVDLDRGTFYRVGINHPKAMNFKSADGKTAAFRVIYFATKGAKRSAIRRTKPPQVEKLDPPNGATDVDPSIKTISVTFDTRMPQGMSWVRTDGLYPGVSGGKAWWSRDGKTCNLAVELVADAEYELSLNGSHYVNFQNKWGIPIDPVVWSFSTAGE